MNTHAKQLTFVQRLAIAFRRFFNPLDMHVKISNEGKAVLNDSHLTRALVNTIISKKKELEEGKSINVDEEGKKFTVTVVKSAIEDNKPST